MLASFLSVYFVKVAVNFLTLLLWPNEKKGLGFHMQCQVCGRLSILLLCKLSWSFVIYRTGCGSSDIGWELNVCIWNTDIVSILRRFWIELLQYPVITIRGENHLSVLCGVTWLFIGPIWLLFDSAHREAFWSMSRVWGVSSVVGYMTCMYETLGLMPTTI